MLPESMRSYPYEHQPPGSTFMSADSPAVACFSCASIQFREVYCLSKLYAALCPQPHLNTAGNTTTIKHGLKLIYLIRYSTVSLVLASISWSIGQDTQRLGCCPANNEYPSDGDQKVKAPGYDIARGLRASFNEPYEYAVQTGA